jgi:hypothetical protein
MRRELKRVTEEMSAGGVRDGGMFLMAQMYGGNDGVKVHLQNVSKEG